MEVKNDILEISTVSGDFLYLHQLMQQPERAELIKAIIKEMNTEQEQNLMKHSENFRRHPKHMMMSKWMNIYFPDRKRSYGIVMCKYI